MEYCTIVFLVLRVVWYYFIFDQILIDFACKVLENNNEFMKIMHMNDWQIGSRAKHIIILLLQKMKKK